MPSTTDRPRRHTPFIRLMLAALLSVSVVIGLFSPWIVFHSSWSQARSHTIATAEHLLALLAHEAAGVLTFNDGVDAQALVEKYTRLPDIQSVQILRNDGSSLAAASVERTRFARRTVDLQAKVQSDAFSALEPPGVQPSGVPVDVGAVTLVVQLDRARETSFSTALQSALQIAALTMLLCIAMILVARRILSPLAALANALRQPDPVGKREHRSDLATWDCAPPPDLPVDIPLSQPPPGAPTEVHVIYDAVEALRVRVAEAQRVLRTYARRLADENAQQELRIGTQEEALRAALKVAETANRAKSLFIANVSHELRTPLQAIILHVRLVLSGAIPERIRDSLQVVMRSSSHLLELIEQILDVSKSEAAGVIELAYRTIPLQAFLDETVSTIRQTLRNDNTLTLRYGGDPKELICDALRFRQIIVNLVRNADKATRGGTIEVGVSRDTDPGNLALYVSDTGRGISEQVRQRIFELFYQENPHEQSDSSSQGIGLGLYLTRNIVAAMGGTIGVHSVLGRGARFDVRLPLLAHHQIGSRTAPVPPDSPHRATAQHPSLRILFAEDETIIRGPLTIFLNEASIAVDECCDGHHTAALIDSHLACYDAIILDNRMPGPTGASLLKLIREQRGSSVPVILLTGDENEELVRLCAHLNAVLLYKPIQPETLITAVRRAVTSDHL